MKNKSYPMETEIIDAFPLILDALKSSFRIHAIN